MKVQKTHRYNQQKLYRLFLLFSVPGLVFLYFSYQYVKNIYLDSENFLEYKYSIEIVKNLSDLIHELQMERGLSAGYLVSRNDILKKRLLKQFKRTDTAFQKVQFIVELKYDYEYMQNIIHRNIILLKKVQNQFKLLSRVRSEVMHRDISFEKEMEFYGNIINSLILVIKNISVAFLGLHGDLNTVANIQLLKEQAGIERAYIYNRLLTKKKEKKEEYLEFLKQLKRDHDELKKELRLSMNEMSKKIFNQIYSIPIETKVLECYKAVVKQQFDEGKAHKCFNASTEYINMYETIYNKILHYYIRTASIKHNQALYIFYFVFIAWIMAFVSIALLIYKYIILLKKNKKFQEELQIASYTFDAFEGVVITDPNGYILKVNNSFSKITGYSADEVIGKHTRLLKSNKHSEEFYKKMWQKLITEGKWQGEIYNKRKNGDIYPEILSITAIKDNTTTIYYIGQFLDISQMKESQRLLRYQAEHDFLTGLLNRKALIKRLAQERSAAIRHDRRHAFLFIDLDNFKMINDSYGHDTGDKLIKIVAKRLVGILREEDIVARISGDEFGVIVLNIQNDYIAGAHALKQICQKIIAEISKAVMLKRQSITISCSIGVKIFPNEENDVYDIIVHADKAMYRAKEQGKNQYVFFNKEIEESMKKFAVLESEIKQSIYRHEFIFHMQPKVELSSGNIVGAEMLIRWIHPKKGLLYPDSFIVEAEQMGLVHHLFMEALHKACAFLEKTEDIFKGTLSINVSSKEILHPDFVDEIISIVSMYRFTLSSLEFEILESSLIENFELVIEKIRKLQQYGMKFSIDDFGTGYSSMTYLQKLPVDTLKIDRSFLQDFDSDTNKEFIKMIINIAKILHLSIVAEGVESEEQRVFLREHGCEYYQGYFFSKPIPEEEFLQLIYQQTDFVII